jgi:hypothetical protein
VKSISAWAFPSKSQIYFGAASQKSKLDSVAACPRPMLANSPAVPRQMRVVFSLAFPPVKRGAISRRIAPTKSVLT